MQKKDILNILGQIRIYTLIDLILFGLAIGSGSNELLGIVLLHLGFIFYLESVHKDSNRIILPKFVWILLSILGVLFYPNPAVLGYFLFSFLYTKKKNPLFSPLAPIFRGIQYYFLAAGIAGFLHPISFLAFGLLTIRNFAGDLRDVTKDRQEGMKTLPIVLGLKRDFKKIHLIAVLATSLVWIYLANISLLCLIPVFALQVLTYELTPR